MCFSGINFAQNIQIQVGNAPNVFASAGRLPIEITYGYNYSQTIYHAGEINQTGYINRIEWHTAPSSSLGSANNSVVYIGTTSKNGFDSTTDWIPVSQLTQVYAGPYTSSTNTWGGINLQTPFYYNGVDNLVIAFDDNHSSWQPSNSFLVEGRPENRGIHRRSDSLLIQTRTHPELQTLFILIFPIHVYFFLPIIVALMLFLYLQL
ncbi:hypothetical protein H9X57_07310 [Flavobacterium piscinae]|uniref:hypothetical protein n=1 Tax=Flavobacterium piscinae TaxID=2506424 RepID=UPI0019871400|nr:hypothetical protein [Flavobacterium piscinae]MBC8883296.1 hypothetical protein [Flavobacterium piscinae]